MEKAKDKYKDIRRKLKIAGIDKKPEVFLKQCTQAGAITGFVMGGLSFVLLKKLDSNPLMAIPVGLVFGFLSYAILTHSLDAKISKRAKEIDKDVMFAGRFLLIKLNSGKPLINSLMEASETYGVASHYFKDIVKNIELGTPLEQTLDDAMDHCPSKKMKRVIFQINSALKAGIDASKNLESVLEEIANDQLVEIQRYGKKLNSLTLFYMLGAVVLPSLGMTIFIVVGSLTGLEIKAGLFFAFTVFLVLLEMMFMMMFKRARPSVNI